MRKFDYGFLAEGLIPASLTTLVAAISELNGTSSVRLSQHPEAYTDLLEIARVQSVKSSNAIEGIITSDQRINAIVRQNSAPLNHDEEEIAGYRDALRLIHENYAHLDFSCRDVLSLHKTLMSLTPTPGGVWKTADNVIIEVARDGKRRVRFRPTPASETPGAMEQLELAYLEARGHPQVNNLLLIPCVILDFLCIHPFADGNGRISRLLSLLLLYKSGFEVGKYVSFEQQINAYKDLYYRALKDSSAGWETGQNDYFAFAENFLTTLYACYKELNKRFTITRSGKVTKRSRIEAAVAEAITPVSKAELCGMLPDVSPTTVEAVLGEMVRDGRARKIGRGRATRYLPTAQPPPTSGKTGKAGREPLQGIREYRSGQTSKLDWKDYGINL